MCRQRATDGKRISGVGLEGHRGLRDGVPGGNPLVEGVSDEQTHLVNEAVQNASRVTSSRVVVLSFVGAVLLAGGNFVAVRFSNRELDPLWGAGASFAIAASIFVCVLLVRRIRLPRLRQLPMLGIYGFLAFGVSYGFLYVGMQQVGWAPGQLSRRWPRPCWVRTGRCPAGRRPSWPSAT